eukprot:TRINITY_DN20397_c0_g1_i1.p1 TRINITY_DN20397_c0_g1~~TRINITY_DN20397_c0_g1_i1.p1  ORF type:complete len:1456 (+),score=462.83 TRINITY_DN20397_c0_g1_i1:86-4369(+)
MAPKKPPPKGGAVPTGTDGRPVGATGLYQESAVPLWNPDPAQAAAELERENWTGGRPGASMDMALNAQTDLDCLFREEHQENEPWDIPRLAQHNAGWKRPHQIFSPFKPVVVRPTVPYDPYPEADITLWGDNRLEPLDEDDRPTVLTRDEAAARYRVVRQLRNSNPVMTNERKGRRAGHAASPRSGASPHRRRDGRQQGTPCYMQTFNSCLMTVCQLQRYVPKGQFLWELIYPKEKEGSLWPKYNPCGKYAVRLWFKGAFRKVVIDDRLPTDVFGQSLLTVTEAKEIWPALLAKAMLRILCKHGSGRIFDDPVWIVGTLMAGYVPAHRSPTVHTAEVLSVLHTLNRQKPQVNEVFRKEGEPAADSARFPERIFVVATPDSSVPQPDPVPPSAEPTPEPGQSGETDKGPRRRSSQPRAGRTPSQPQLESAPPVPALSAPPSTAPAPAPAAAASPGASSARREELRRLGLHADQLYHVVESRAVQETTMVRLASPYISWSGEGGYEDTDTWTAAFERELGFKREDRMQNDNQWLDCWMLWETFAEIFQSVVVMRCTASTNKFQHAIVVRDEDCPPRLSPSQPQALSRWIRFPAEAPVRLLCAYQGPVGDIPPPSAPSEDAKGAAPKGGAKRGSVKPAVSPAAPPSEPDEPLPASHLEPGFHCTLRAFSWSDPVPLRRVVEFSCQDHATDSFTLAVPPCPDGRAYQLELSGMARGSVFAVLSPSPEGVEVRDTRDELCTACLGVGSWQEEGEIDEHVPREVTVWLRRIITVKGPTKAIFQLSALPPGSVSSAPVEDPKAKPAKGKAKEAAPQPAFEPIDDEALQRMRQEWHSKRIDLLSWARLSLLSLDTGERYHDTAGFLSAHLDARKDGKEAQYTLCAYAEAAEAYPRAVFRLTACADSLNFDRGAAVGFRDMFRREGCYRVNRAAQLFRYVLTPQEILSCTVLLRMDAEREVPFTFRILKGDELLWECYGTQDAHQSGPPGGARVHGHGTVVIEHLNFNAPEKGGALNRYIVECLLSVPDGQGGRDTTVAQALHADVHRMAVRRSRERGTQSPPGPGSSGSEEEAEPPPDSGSNVAELCPEWNIQYLLKLCSSSGKLTLDDDSAEKDRLDEVKQNWGREEGGAGGAAGKGDAKGKPPKGGAAPAVQEDTRGVRALRARQAYLRNPSAAISGDLRRAGTSPEAADAEPQLELVPPADPVVIKPQGPQQLIDMQRWGRAAGIVTAVGEGGLFSVQTDCGELVDGLRRSELELLATWQSLEAAAQKDPPPASSPSGAGKKKPDSSQEQQPVTTPQTRPRSPPDRDTVEAKDYVVITARRELQLVGCGEKLIVCDDAARRARLQAEEELVPQWRKEHDEQSESRRADEERTLKDQGDEQIEWHHLGQEKRSDAAAEQRKHRDEHFNMLRERGDIPKEPEPEPEDPKKKKKK